MWEVQSSRREAQDINHPQLILRTPPHKCTLETQEIKQVADERACACIAVAGVRLAEHEAVLEAEKVEEVEDADAGGLVANDFTPADLHALRC